MDVDGGVDPGADEPAASAVDTEHDPAVGISFDFTRFSDAMIDSSQSETPDETEDETEDDGAALLGTIMQQSQAAVEMTEQDLSLPISSNTAPSSGALFEVLLPGILPDMRAQYEEIYSNVIENIIHNEKSFLYDVEFTDGRTETLDAADVSKYRNASEAMGRLDDMAKSKNRRMLAVGSESDSEVEFVGSRQLSVVDDEEEEDTDGRARFIPARGDNESDALSRNATGGSTRILRQSRSRQVPLSVTSAEEGLANGDISDLALRLQDASDQDDDDFLPVVSDIARNPNRFGRKAPSRRPNLRKRMTRRAPQTRREADDSDIEFEQPRRSSRANKPATYMTDDILLDDDSFYISDDRSTATPKVISMREVFRPIASDSKFGANHMNTCFTCQSSNKRGPFVYCQGCSLIFHKNCLGFRSSREHRVTKVGDNDFVLQCKFCIGVYGRKDKKAPDYSKCQSCQKPGKGCKPFSKKQTASEEEKLREQNGGEDPIFPVPPELLNNAALTLARCVTCHRGWHVDHLPSSARNNEGDRPIGTDLNSERLDDFSVDWRCHECIFSKHKIHRLVAWRPWRLLKDAALVLDKLTEDDKEYLVKWDSMSYAHCSWLPGAWVYGVAASGTRLAFAKRANAENLLHLTKEAAIPDSFLMADIVFTARIASSASHPHTKEDELAKVSDVDKMLVKFQGLSYDDVVWDTPPSCNDGDVYKAFVNAYRIYVNGKYFHCEPCRRIRDRIKEYKQASFQEVDSQPAGLKRGKLMGYQLEGLNWLLENFHQGRSVVLADEMGLGKTVQVISLVASLVLDQPRCWPFLIVVPNATCLNWLREFRQWTPDLRVVTYHGGKEPQELAYKYELFPNGKTELKAHAVIMSYDSAQDPRTKSLFDSVHWTGLVVDEGQRLKNDQNMLYGALRSLCISFRLLLTGTPLQNNKRELFNLLQFIDDTQNAEKLDEEYNILDKETLPKLHEKIRPYFLRRTKAGVLKFLPPMAQIILPVTMTVLQKKLSKSIMAKNPQLIKAMFANDKLNKTERGSLNNILMQLRKCLCHPFVYSDAIEERNHDSAVIHRNLVEASAKLILLNTMLPKLRERGHRVLIFSQFLHQLDIMEDFLAGLGFEFRRLDGSISSLEKQRRIDAFNAEGSSIFAFLLSTRAGGVGINLATADTVIILDPDFNPHQDIQALSRAHRIGQEKKVLCFQLVTKDSVEERIMQVGRKKMALDHALIESMDDDELAGDDLESILKHGAQALFDEDYEKTAIHYDSASIDRLLDRSQVEQTKASRDGSADAQFTYAKVWSNEKSNFTDGLDTAEDEAPELIGSSVWDRILAEREEEAIRTAEANKEILGRGGRRRTTINYNTTGLEGTMGPGDLFQGEVSDESDEFVQHEAHDKSDDEAFKPKDANNPKADQDALVKYNAAESANAVAETDATNREPKQKRTGRPSGRIRANTSTSNPHKIVPRAAGGHRNTQTNRPGIGNGVISSLPMIPTLSSNGVVHQGPNQKRQDYQQPSRTPSNSSHNQYNHLGRGNLQQPQQITGPVFPYSPYILGPSYEPVLVPLSHMSQELSTYTETDLRLAIDRVRRSSSRSSDLSSQQLQILQNALQLLRRNGQSRSQE